jgi:hypothetical protein
VVASLDKLLVDQGVLGLDLLFDERLDDLRRTAGQLSLDHFAGGPVDGNEIPLPDGSAVDFHGAVSVVDVQRRTSHHAGFSHTPGDQGGVGGHPAAGGQDSFGGVHPVDVFGGGFDADENILLPLFGQFHGPFRVEDRDPAGRARSGIQTFGQELSGFDGFRLGLGVEDRRQKLIQGVGVDAGIAVFLSISFSPTISTAIRRAAKAVRFPLRVWSIQSFPCWMVNSMSCMSLKCFSSRW